MKIQTLSIIAGTTLCNAHCPYCISKMTPAQGVSLKEPQINWRNFEKSCQLAQISGVTNVLITGKGEPTLYPNQITRFLEKIKKFNFPILELQTNGILLSSSEYEEHLKTWYNLGLTIIALSIVHYENKKNQKIFSENYPELKDLIGKLHKIGFSVRLSCTMLKGFIDSPKEVENLINKSRKWKVEQLSIRKLAMPVSSESKNVFEWTKDNLVDEKNLDEIKDFIIKNSSRLMTFHNGAVIYDFKGQNICLTDALTIKPDSDDLRQIIFFPDGHLRFDWQYKGATLI